jgi:hypothetical protein
MKQSFLTHRFLLLLMCMVALIGATCAGFGSTASAHPLSTAVLQCEGSESVQYQPGLTNTPRPTTITATATLAPCTVPTQPSITGGSGGYSVSLTASCTALAFPDYTEIYHWNDQTQSTVHYMTTVVVRGVSEIVLTSTGTVISGFGLGSLATQQETFVNIDFLACLTPQGLPSNGALVLLTFG